MASKKIKKALISVFDKEGLSDILSELNKLEVSFISTGGTNDFIKSLGYECESVENATGYPSILGGRVKTLHPQILGGILYRRDNETDNKQIKSYGIPSIDLVIVDLYPFEKTVKENLPDDEIIEKIDIGGISLIRSAAKNYNDVLVVGSKAQYEDLYNLILEKKGETDIDDRLLFAKKAFGVSSAYDSAIFNYFDKDTNSGIRINIDNSKKLRYGENPHQKAFFYGKLGELFYQISGKELSYNNLLDIDAAVSLISDFDTTSVGILKHNNACGFASRDTVKESWTEALKSDPISAFGGVIISNREIDLEAAKEINKIFFEVIIAPSYEEEAIGLFMSKKNVIILKQKFDIKKEKPIQYRSLLNGVIFQDKDLTVENRDNLKVVTNSAPTEEEIRDLIFANKLVKHTKSNAIVLVKDNKLIASGTGQTSRVDALKQSIEKAKLFNINLKGAVMASDAFFPFSDCVEIAAAEGITSVIHPGGSIRDKDSIDYCNEKGISMVITGIRHFKH